MVAMLSLAILFPPWETPPSQAPEFLGLHFILNPPTPEAIVSRLLLTIELVTIAIAGLYGSFLLPAKKTLSRTLRKSAGGVLSRSVSLQRTAGVRFGRRTPCGLAGRSF